MRQFVGGKTLQSGLESVKESDGVKFVRPVIVPNK